MGWDGLFFAGIGGIGKGLAAGSLRASSLLQEDGPSAPWPQGTTLSLDLRAKESSEKTLVFWKDWRWEYISLAAF